MSVIKAYAMPHPPLAVPQIGRGQEKKIAKTIAALEEVGADIACIAPETIIYITPHSTLYADHFHISPGSMARGNFGRFGAGSVALETSYDEEMLEEIESIADAWGISAGPQGERDAALDHGVMVPMWYIDRHYSNCKTLRISQSGMSPADHYMLGQIIAEAADKLERKVVVIGSSDLSHKLKDDGPYGFAPEGPEFDKMVTDAIHKADFLALFNIPEKLREAAAECGYNSLMVLAGLFEKKNVESRLLAYEGPFGVGYAVAEFAETGKNENRNVLEQYMESVKKLVNQRRNSEDDYQKLARQSLEHKVKSGSTLKLPDGLPDELINERAGVFVSIHKEGRLRGCIGTIAPTTGCIAEEIIQNAVSSGLSDTRFARVSISELDSLVYKVDVLMAPEKIESMDELDVKKYGVIVTCGMRRGLLLPNLDGVDTVKQQVEIAMSKGGISPGESVELERFEVVRHE